MPKIDWNVENTRIFCGLMARQVEKENRPDTFLNSVGYAAVEKGFKDRTCIELTKGQIKNKWDKLKEDLKAWKKLTMRQTEIGWNNGTIDMDNEWWKKVRADIPGCGKFRKHPLQNEDELTTCFQGIINVGADHWSSCDGNVAAPTLDTVTQQAAQDEGVALDREGATQHATEGDEVEEVTPSPSSCKRAGRHVEDTRKKVKTTNAVLIQEACPSMASLANAYAAKKDGNSLLMKS